MKWAALAAVGVAAALEPETLELVVWAVVALLVALLEYRRHIRAAEIEAGATVLAATVAAQAKDEDEESDDE